jgi:uncharacterized Tic20 family protein
MAATGGPRGETGRYDGGMEATPPPGAASAGEPVAQVDPAAPPPGAAPPPPAANPVVGSTSASSARDLVVWTHLSALVGLVGIPSPLGPLVLWLVKREADPFVDDQGKEALNFNLSALIYIVVLFVGGFFFSFITLGFGVFLFVPAAIAAMAAWVILVIVAAVKSSKGELFRYPLTIRFVR